MGLVFLRMRWHLARERQTDRCIGAHIPQKQSTVYAWEMLLYIRDNDSNLTDTSMEDVDWGMMGQAVQGRGGGVGSFPLA